MRARLRSSDTYMYGAAAVILAGAALAFAPSHLQDVEHREIFIAFAALIAISDLFEVVLSDDRHYSLGLAPALAFTILGDNPLAETLILFASGMLVATLVRTLTGRYTNQPSTAAHVIALAAAAASYEAIADASILRTFDTPHTDIYLLGLMAMFLCVLLLVSLAAAARRASHQRLPLWPLLANTLRANWGLHLSILSVGALLALAYPTLGWWSFPLVLAPLAATQFAFKQLAEIRRTYLQTIRALSKVPEMAGYSQPGHSTRVAELSVAIARELALAEEDVKEIEYAALLHDIGRVSIADPDTPQGVGRMELAVVGAAIVRETGQFPHVADMIQQQHDPYRRRGEDVTPNLPIGARIIKVASTYDDLTKPGGVGLSPWDALERLHLGMAYEYDPTVIQTLTKVLEKRGAI